MRRNHLQSYAIKVRVRKFVHLETAFLRVSLVIFLVDNEGIRIIITIPCSLLQRLAKVCDLIPKYVST